MGGVPRNMDTNRLTGLSYTSCGAPICCTTPSFITTIMSEMLMASSWSWVTKIVVTPVSCWMRRISSRVCKRSRASRFESGSSMSNTRGVFTSARAMATRCCWPPESSLGLRSNNVSICTSFAAVIAFSFMAGLFIFSAPFKFCSGNMMFSSTVRWGYSA